MARVLLVEDDLDLSMVVTDGLEAHSHEVEYAGTAPMGREKLRQGSYDLIIMDWDLPGGTGVELVREFREGGGQTPVIMLTGKSDVAEKELGLESGADDYLTKPFQIRELLARVKSMVRRSTNYSQGKAPGTASESEIAPGAVLGGKYLLEDVIGKGGMATIWKAKHLTLGKSFVVKVLQQQLATRQAALKRFEIESQAMARLNHPNIVGVIDFDFTGGKPYLVLEYVPGETLRSMLETYGPMPVWLAMEITVQILQGLEEAHKSGIVHRDLKPDNVIVQERTDRPDWVKILDFGIAQLTDSQERLTEEGLIVGTVEYISPEQLQDKVIDGRADVYAMGVILYEMLTGHLPYDAKTPHALLMKKLVEDPPPVWSERKDVSKDSPASAILEKALERDRDRRFSDAAEMREAVQQALWRN